MDFEWHWGSRLPTCERWQRESSCFDMTACCSTSDTQNPPPPKKKKPFLCSCRGSAKLGCDPEKCETWWTHFSVCAAGFFMERWKCGFFLHPFHPFTIPSQSGVACQNWAPMAAPLSCWLIRRSGWRGAWGLGGCPPTLRHAVKRKTFGKCSGNSSIFKGALLRDRQALPRSSPPHVNTQWIRNWVWVESVSDRIVWFMAMSLRHVHTTSSCIAAAKKWSVGVTHSSTYLRPAPMWLGGHVSWQEFTEWNRFHLKRQCWIHEWKWPEKKFPFCCLFHFSHFLRELQFMALAGLLVNHCSLMGDQRQGCGLPTWQNMYKKCGTREMNSSKWREFTLEQTWMINPKSERIGSCKQRSKNKIVIVIVICHLSLSFVIGWERLLQAKLNDHVQARSFWHTHTTTTELTVALFFKRFLRERENNECVGKGNDTN